MIDREARRAQRINLEEPLLVSMGSIGSDVQYDLTTKDISNKGFFLSYEKPGRFPFLDSSILEVWLSLDEEQKIFFNGKMARIIMPDDEAAKVFGPGIAIQIIQISEDHQKMLDNFVNDKTHEHEEEQRTAKKAS
jgi:hypothetical protein